MGYELPRERTFSKLAILLIRSGALFHLEAALYESN